jgi:dihydrolipoamide dehydrogenase
MYDVIVIGGGAGGYAGAIRSAQLGAKVAVVEMDLLGGVCVNRGCIPTKTWLKAAESVRAVKMAEKYGVKATLESIDFDTILMNKEECQKKIKMGMESLLGNNGVEIIRGHAKFKDAKTIEVSGQSYQAKSFIIATGSKINVPEIDGLDSAMMTTDDVLDMKAAPFSVLVVGDDTIAVEMAGLLNTFGSKVTIAVSGQRILPDEDVDSSQRLSQAFRDDGIEILTRYELSTVRPSKNLFSCTLTGKEEKEIVVEKVLLSLRRIANTGGLDLANAAVRINEDQSIKVNEHLQTTTPGIYAIGDVTGGTMQSHAASAMAVVAAENAMGGNSTYDQKLVPRGTWTTPQVASVGLTEEQAEKMDLDIDVGYFPYSINGYSIARGESFGAVKIIADAEFRTIYGVHIVGPNATELIGEASLAMQLEYTTEELAQGIRVHPSFSEAVVDAARDAEKWALYLPKKK